jgi:hypothetical protein
VLVLVGAIVVGITTDNGELVIETDDPNVEVVVSQGGKQVTIIDGQTKQHIKLASGTYEVELGKGSKELRLSTGHFTLTRGGREIVRVRRELAGAKQPGGPSALLPQSAVAIPARRDGFVPIFNGKDLTGWVVDSGDKNAWEVKNGELVAHGPEKVDYLNQGYLLTDRDYTDFRLRLQFQRREETAESGIALRAVPHETAHDSEPARPKQLDFPFHLTVYLGKFRGTDMSGGLWWSPNINVQPALIPDQLAQVKPLGEWNDMEIEMRGQSLRIAVNGRDVQNVMLNKTRPEKLPAVGLNRFSGRLGILKRTREVRFRNIAIEELSPTKTQGSAAAEDKGFVPLFSGKDLTGWHVVRGDKRDWQVEQGQLRIQGTDWAHRSFLVSDKEYKDYAVRFEFQADDKARAFFIVRSLPGRGADDIPGGHIMIAADKRAGRFTWANGDFLSPSPRPQLQPPENWNRMEIRLHGGRLRVLHNGTQVQNLNLNQIPDRPVTMPYLKRSQGTIEFLKHMRTVRLRNLEWCDLSNTPPPTDPVSPAQIVTYPQGKHAVSYGDGEWLREGDELVQAESNSPVCLVFGDVEWTDYDFSCDAMRVNGPNGFDIIFRAPDKFNWEVFAVGTWNNQRHAWASLNENVGTGLRQSRNAGVDANRWYKVRVSVRGQRCQCFLDEKLLFDFTDQIQRRGAVGFRTWATSARFRNIKVTSPDGKVLWEGVPELDALESERR